MLHHHIIFILRKASKKHWKMSQFFFRNFLLRRPSGLFHMLPNSEVGYWQQLNTPVYSKSLNSCHQPVMRMPIWIYRLTTWFHFLKTNRFYRMKYFIGAKIIIHVIQRISVLFFSKQTTRKKGCFSSWLMMFLFVLLPHNNSILWLWTIQDHKRPRRLGCCFWALGPQKKKRERERPEQNSRLSETH